MRTISWRELITLKRGAFQIYIIVHLRTDQWAITLKAHLSEITVTFNCWWSNLWNRRTRLFWVQGSIVNRFRKMAPLICVSSPISKFKNWRTSYNIRIDFKAWSFTIFAVQQHLYSMAQLLLSRNWNSSRRGINIQ